jgi:hypothetical protein
MSTTLILISSLILFLSSCGIKNDNFFVILNLFQDLVALPQDADPEDSGQHDS